MNKSHDVIDGDGLLDIARAAVDMEGRAVLEVSNQIDDTMLETIAMIERSEGKVFVTGAGTSGTIAHRFAHLLSVSGTPAVYLHAMDALHGSMGAIEPDDVIITISKGGESDEVNQLCQLLKEKGVGVSALASTLNPPSPALSTCSCGCIPSTAPTPITNSPWAPRSWRKHGAMRWPVR